MKLTQETMTAVFIVNMVEKIQKNKMLSLNECMRAIGISYNTFYRMKKDTISGKVRTISNPNLRKFKYFIENNLERNNG